jgi:4-hydroxy-tetrahydrodipicolinate reductase
MSDALRVAVLGTGQMGSGIVRLLLGKEGVEVVGVYGRRPDRAGTDVGKLLGLDRDLGVKLTNNLSELLSTTKAQVVVQATCSKVNDASQEIKTAVQAGAHVVSIAEEMAYPAYEEPGLTEEIDALCRQHGVSVLGTGINPGFVLDLLVISLTGVCYHVESITAQRINDLSPFGTSVLTTQGVGISPEAFHQGVKDGTVVGHFGFPESITMIAQALGWTIERVEQTREPIISNVKRETPSIRIEPGQTAGCKHTATGYVQGKPAIHLIHPQQVHPHLEDVQTGDYIDIKGEPNVSFSGSPEIPGGVGTIALAVNMIPQVVSAAPGLKTMAELPAPSAIMGDIRELIRFRSKGGQS